MTKTSEKAAAQASEGQDGAIGKRSIQMKMFTTDTQKAEVALAYQKTPEDLKSWQVPVGQIVGVVYEVNERVFEVKGEPTSRLYAVGEFEATNYATGEVLEALQADLPGYYLEGLRGALSRNNGAAVLLGVEVVLVATGKAIPVAYEVRNLVPREPDSPINRLKAAIQKTGKLRLPPPTPLAPVDEPDRPHPDRAVAPQEVEEAYAGGRESLTT